MTDALAEWERSTRATSTEEGLLARRQAAEKAWGYVVERLDELLDVRSHGRGAHPERAEKLRELDRVAGTSLYRSYAEMQDRLHGDCVYTGACPGEEVARLLRSAEEFPRKVEEARRRISGRRG